MHILHTQLDNRMHLSDTVEVFVWNTFDSFFYGLPVGLLLAFDASITNRTMQPAWLLALHDMALSKKGHCVVTTRKQKFK